jgi:hypothetical protein
MLEVSFKKDKAIKTLKKLSEDAFPTAVRNSLNDMAKSAGTYARSKTLKEKFHLRNKWTRGSIVPTPGKSFGLIPKSKKNIDTMFSETGSRQPYLLEQEKGFRKKAPSIPLSKTSRKSGAFSGSVKPSLRLKKITKSIRTYRDVKSKAKTKKGKTFAMLSLSARRGYQGNYFLNVPGVFPRGIYKFRTKKMTRKSGFPRLTRLRSQENRTISYKKKNWFSPIVNKYQQQKTYDFFWNKQVKKQIDPLFIK